MTSQPQWELVYATDYSALYRDTTGVYPPELAIAQTIDDADEDDIDAALAVVYRFPLNRCWRVTNDDGSTFLCEQNPAREAELPHPLCSYMPWYAPHLDALVRLTYWRSGELADALCSDDPATLAKAFEAIGGHYGYDNFDSTPNEWTASEFEAWPERGVKLSSDERDVFTNGYISCALWCGVVVYKHDDDCPCHERSEDGTAYDAEDCTCDHEMESSSDQHDESELDDDAVKTLTDDARAFYTDNVADLRACTLDMERAGHDFWLTRNRHGAGFWDEKGADADANAALDRLTEASHTFGEVTLVQHPNTKIGVL